MNWFDGNIAEAVNLSKTKNSIFVVYVEGPDELSRKITALINHDDIRKYLESKHFVAIKIQSGSEAYMQFAQIYQLVPLPSLFFIGRNGTPLQVVTGVTNTVEELEEKILTVLKSTGIEAANIEVNSSSSNQASMEDQAQGASGYTAPPETTPNDFKTNSTRTPEDSCEAEERSVSVTKETETPDSAIENQRLLDEKMQRAKELVEKQRKEKEALEKEAEKKREIRRRVDGQKLQDLKKSQEEQELIQMKEDRKREKLQEQEARRRILHQIEQDRLERAQRFGQTIPAPSTTPTTDKAVKTSTARPSNDSNINLARIQFKKPGGDIEMHTFECADTFFVLRTHVVTNILPSIGIRDYTLATTFPRREFTSADNETSLKDLGLSPTAVLLILPVSRNSARPNVVSTTSRGLFDMAYSIIWNLFTPIFAVYGYVKSLIFNRPAAPRENAPTTGAEKRANEDGVSDHDAAKRRNMSIFESQQPSTSGGSSSRLPGEENKGAYRRVGGSNIHRLHESRDSDDENNTWNGNSTQQQ